MTVTGYELFSARLIHIFSIAVWFGPKLLVPADLRGAIRDGSMAFEASIRRVNLVQKVAITASMVALASGLTMIFLRGGFSMVDHRIHLGLGLTLLLFALGAFGVDKAWKRLRDGMRAGKPAPELLQLERRLSYVMTAENGIWFVVLILMVFPFQF